MPTKRPTATTAKLLFERVSTWHLPRLMLGKSSFRFGTSFGHFILVVLVVVRHLCLVNGHLVGAATALQVHEGPDSWQEKEDVAASSRSAVNCALASFGIDAFRAHVGQYQHADQEE